MTVQVIEDVLPPPPAPPNYFEVMTAMADVLTAMLATVQHLAATAPTAAGQSALIPAIMATNLKLQHAKGMLGAIRGS